MKLRIETRGFALGIWHEDATFRDDAGKEVGRGLSWWTFALGPLFIMTTAEVKGE